MTAGVLLHALVLQRLDLQPVPPSVSPLREETNPLKSRRANGRTVKQDAHKSTDNRDDNEVIGQFNDLVPERRVLLGSAALFNQCLQFFQP